MTGYQIKKEFRSSSTERLKIILLGKMGNSLASIDHTRNINIPIPRNLPTTLPSSLSCNHFQRYLDINGWCKKCTMKSVTSGHRGVDKLIRRTQSKSDSWSDPFLEWIPFENFRDICKIGEGGFSVVYSATWIQGRRKNKLDKGGKKNEMQNIRTNPIKVTLKCIKNSQEMSEEYLKRLKIYYKWSLIQSRKRMQQLLRFYGMSQDPSTGEYILVTQYTEHGSLRSLLHRHFSSFRWTEKIWWLCDIISNLLTLHKAGIVHGNIHAGNVLQVGDLARETTSALSDTGLNYPASPLLFNNSGNGKKNVYGILPYLAPEVILGKDVSKRSDIYSIGILMIEILTGIPPFSHRPHNEQLALEICQGLRPELAEGTPKVYGELAKHCCCTNPSLRPTAKQLFYIFNHWWSLMNLDNSEVYEIRNSFLRADKLIPDIIEEKRIMAVRHEEAIYTSRLLQFQDVLDRRNYSTENYEVIITNNESINSTQFLLLDLNLPDITIDI
ncbi:kinase-like domain-containing protein [Glomus cerebriforme]|uniref:Kinase-like domain-containing protein n=1 Tax=Glomus cerebriforme TaxID=658196 RepID=A0A397TIF5_9GLOM|nr:kinase-like domain-containing protein [Glomus cerebriforme]